MIGKWFRKQIAFEQDVLVSASPSVVLDFFADFCNMVYMHPLIVSVEKVRVTEELHPKTYYKIRDRLQWGPLGFYINYTVASQVIGNEVLAEVHQFPRIYMKNCIRFEEDGTGTRVTENVVIEAGSWFANYVKEEAYQSHRDMFQALQKYFEK